MSHEAERYQGTIELAYKKFPPLKIKTIRKDKKTSWLERVATASAGRKFEFTEDWYFDIDAKVVHPDLVGEVRIPMNKSSSEIQCFDGASLPAPWLVAMLTFGFIRPIGVLLIASIIHDICFQEGGLEVNGQFLRLERHQADQLFREVTQTVNGMPGVAWLSWYFVRLAWPTVSYAGTQRAGKPPVAEYVFLVFIVLLVFTLLCFLGVKKFLAILFGGYFVTAVVLGNLRKYFKV